jgi:hypothetical protein
VGPQGHTLTQTRHNEGIADSQQGEVLAECQILGMQEHDRLVRERREPGVDTRDDVGDTTGKLVALGSLQGNLDEDDLPLPFGILVEEGFECGDLVTYSLPCAISWSS